MPRVDIFLFFQREDFSELALGLLQRVYGGAQFAELAVVVLELLFNLDVLPGGDTHVDDVCREGCPCDKDNYYANRRRFDAVCPTRTVRN